MCWLGQTQETCMTSLPPLPLLDGALFVSSTFLDTLSCPREAQHYKLDARVGAKEGSGLLFGSHLHTALSLWYRLSEYSLSEDEKLSRVQQILTEAFASRPVEEGDWRTLNWAVEVFQHYVAKYRDWGMEIMRWEEPQKCKRCEGKGKKVVVIPTVDMSMHIEPCLWCNGTGSTSIMSEVPFVVKLMDYEIPSDKLLVFHKSFPDITTRNVISIPVYYHGFMDLVVRNQSGLIFPLDFKTTALELGPGYWDGMNVLAQTRGYAWALQQLLGITCHGYIIHGIRSSTPPQNVLTGKLKRDGTEPKTISQWWDDAIQDQRKDFGEGELEEWHRNACAQVETWLWHYSRGYFPQQKGQCRRKYGRCQYWEICGAHPASDRALLLFSDQFKDKDPISYVIQTQ